jgi:hypothetical protein
MTEFDYSEEWEIVSSTSRFFPVRSTVLLTPKEQPKSARFAIAVNWVDHAELPLFEADFPGRIPGTFQGPFDHPKDGPKKQHFELGVTVNFGSDGKRYLFGVVFKPSFDDEPAGVWVAEEKPPPNGPPSKPT